MSVRKMNVSRLIDGLLGVVDLLDVLKSRLQLLCLLLGRECQLIRSGAMNLNQRLVAGRRSTFGEQAAAAGPAGVGQRTGHKTGQQQPSLDMDYVSCGSCWKTA